MKVTIWSEHKIEMFQRKEHTKDAGTIEGLREFETHDHSLSSEIEVNDEAQLKQFLLAAYNETDVDLKFHIEREALTLTDDQFESDFQPYDNHLDDDSGFGGLLYETFGPDLEHAKFVNSFAPDHVWTVLETDEGHLMIANGMHFVNRHGYIITKNPAPQHTDVEVIDEDQL